MTRTQRILTSCLLAENSSFRRNAYRVSVFCSTKFRGKVKRPEGRNPMSQRVCERKRQACHHNFSGFQTDKTTRVRVRLLRIGKGQRVRQLFTGMCDAFDCACCFVCESMKFTIRKTRNAKQAKYVHSACCVGTFDLCCCVLGVFIAHAEQRHSIFTYHPNRKHKRAGKPPKREPRKICRHDAAPRLFRIFNLAAQNRGDRERF